MRTDDPGAPGGIVQYWQERHRRMATAWQELAAADRHRGVAASPHWEARLGAMRATQRTLLSTAAGEVDRGRCSPPSTCTIASSR